MPITKSNLKALCFIVAALLLMGCNHMQAKKVSECAKLNRDYAINYFVNKNARTLSITLENKTKRNLCYDSFDWPDHNGDIHFGGDLLTMLVDNITYAFENENLGYRTAYDEAVIAEHSFIQEEVELSKFRGVLDHIPSDNIQFHYGIALFFCN